MASPFQPACEIQLLWIHIFRVGEFSSLFLVNFVVRSVLLFPLPQLCRQPFPGPSVGWCAFGCAKIDIHPSLKLCQGSGSLPACFMAICTMLGFQVCDPVERFVSTGILCVIQ